MGRVVKLRISGRGSETDAPTVEDALDQMRDHLDVMKGVEEAATQDGARAPSCLGQSSHNWSGH